MKSLRNSNERKKEKALAIYLFWLKTGIEQNILASYFGIDDPYHNKISIYCSQVRNALINDFVPIFLGAKHIKRSDWLLNNTISVKILYNLNNFVNFVLFVMVLTVIVKRVLTMNTKTPI